MVAVIVGVYDAVPTAKVFVAVSVTGVSVGELSGALVAVSLGILDGVSVKVKAAAAIVSVGVGVGVGVSVGVFVGNSMIDGVFVGAGGEAFRSGARACLWAQTSVVAYSSVAR